MTLSAYRHTAAAIAAAAIFESFPDVKLLGGQETSMGFSYDFLFPHLIHPETIPMIEQAMRQIARERREIRLLEMVPFSAKELLKAQGHMARVEELEECHDQLVQIVQMGSFHDLASGEPLKNSNQLTAFRIDGFTSLPNGVTRLTGFAYPTKEELNEFLKRLKHYPEKRHEALGKAQGLWKRFGQEMIWLKKGLKIRNGLVQFFERHVLQETEWISASKGVNRMNLIQELGRPVAEIFLPSLQWNEEAGLYGNGGLEIRIFTHDLNSLLHLIEKSLNILGLEYKREFCAEDALGREWPMVVVRKVGRGAEVSVWIEKILALLLEKYERLERLAFENK